MARACRDRGRPGSLDGHARGRMRPCGGAGIWWWWCIAVLVPWTFDSTTGHYGLTDRMSEYEKSNIRLSTMSGVRTDTRRSMDARPVTLEIGVLSDAFGSARVRIGRTDVLAAVRAEFSKPYPTGRIGPGPLVFQVDLSGLAGEGLACIPRDDDLQMDCYVLMVTRTLEKLYNTFATRVITDPRLAIIPGKLNWMLNVYVTAFESDGNILDACLMAVRGALRSTWFPNILIDRNPDSSDPAVSIKIDEDRTKYWRLDALACPLTVTYLRVGSEWVIDPNEEEECAADARLILGLRILKLREVHCVCVGMRAGMCLCVCLCVCMCACVCVCVERSPPMLTPCWVCVF